MPNNFKVGERVTHPKFGTGEVVKVDGNHVQVRLGIDDNGLPIVKKILSEFLNLPESRDPPKAPRRVLPPRIIQVVGAEEFEGKPVPPRPWHVQGLLPGRTVSLLSGDGGAGKSLLALQLSCATALAYPWIGLDVTPGRVLYLSAEDDTDEIHRRLFDIAASYQCQFGDLSNLKILPLAGEDAVLAAPSGRSGVIAATPLWHQLVKAADEWAPKLIVLDTLADLFGGEENHRSQARQFIGLLRGLALRLDAAVLVLAHPSLSGISSGTGSSGSTGWNNSVRSRLYLERIKEPDGTESDPDARRLRTMKSNYGRTGSEIRLRWRDGVFTTESSPANTFVQVEAEAQADRIFLDLVAAYSAEHRAVSPRPSGNYAPVVFARDSRSKGLNKVALAKAMNRLFSRSRIETIEVGPPSKRRAQIALPAERGEGGK
jgi:RecA-family ATPase